MTGSPCVAVEISDRGLPLRMRAGHARARLMTSPKPGLLLEGSAVRHIAVTMYAPLMLVTTFLVRMRQR
jgi:hypothetical protein